MTIEFSKLLLIIDYLTIPVLILCAILYPNIDFTAVICAWIAQIGISSGAYYWKARHENRVKVPIKVIRSLPKDVRESVDMTAIITAIVQSD